MDVLPQCFVISAFGVRGSAERKHADLVLNYIIKPVVEAVAKYEVRRGDDDGRPGLISVDVINAILEADLVIADLSFLNPNVFYELGLRHRTTLPTIHIASHDTKLPFDNADHRTIFYDISDWHSHEMARKGLGDSIRNLEKKQPVTNPVSVAQAFRKGKELQATLSQIEELIAPLEERIEQITEMPAKGTITRDWFAEVTEQRRTEIMEIVDNIRQRIDERSVSQAPEAAPQAADVLRRLAALEAFARSYDSVHLHSSTTTPQ